MGSGKTTVGPLVAARLGWRFIDVDDVIEAEAGADHRRTLRPPRRGRFPRPGARHHRPAGAGEAWCWPSAAAQSRALQPATCCSPRPEPCSSILKSSWRPRWHVAAAPSTRPVLADQANLAARYQRRLPLYRTAHVSIPVDALTPEQVADAVVRAAGLL